jgi:hypothetical protein
VVQVWLATAQPLVEGQIDWNVLAARFEEMDLIGKVAASAWPNGVSCRARKRK